MTGFLGNKQTAVHEENPATRWGEWATRVKAEEVNNMMQNTSLTFILSLAAVDPTVHFLFQKI